MKFGVYSLFFLGSTIKFLFTPFAGPKSQLTFWETYLSCVAGAIFSAAIFYFASEFFLKRAHKKKLELIRLAQLNNIPMVHKKKFTRTNKFIVRIKTRLGIYGISLFAPLILSVPLGSIVAAKFYGKEKKTFPLIVLGMIINGLIITGLAYTIF